MKVLVLTSTYPRFEGDPTAPFIESARSAHGRARPRDARGGSASTASGIDAAIEDGVTPPRLSLLTATLVDPVGIRPVTRGGRGSKRSLLALAPVVFASAAHTCRAVASRGAIDVVHAHWVVPNGPIAAFALRRRDVPLVVTVHGSDVDARRAFPLDRIAGAMELPSSSRRDDGGQPIMLERVEGLGPTPTALDHIPLGYGPAHAFRPRRLPRHP